MIRINRKDLKCSCGSILHDYQDLSCDKPTMDLPSLLVEHGDCGGLTSKIDKMVAENEKFRV